MKRNLFTAALVAALAFLPTGCQTLNTLFASDFVKKQLALIEQDFKNKLLERLDKLFGDNGRPPDNPGAVAPPLDVPALAWSFGGLNPAPPVEVWWGKFKASRNNTRVELDYANAPDWYRLFNGKTPVGDENCFEVAVFYKDGTRYVGGKFDWINLPRAFRDLKHCLDYKGWNGQYWEQPVAYVVIANTKTRQWMIFTP